jgi:hypothetical protein
MEIVSGVASSRGGNPGRHVPLYTRRHTCSNIHSAWPRGAPDKKNEVFNEEFSGLFSEVGRLRLSICIVLPRKKAICNMTSHACLHAPFVRKTCRVVTGSPKSVYMHIPSIFRKVFQSLCNCTSNCRTTSESHFCQLAMQYMDRRPTILSPTILANSPGYNNPGQKSCLQQSWPTILSACTFLPTSYTYTTSQTCPHAALFKVLHGFLILSACTQLRSPHKGPLRKNYR